MCRENIDEFMSKYDDKKLFNCLTQDNEKITKILQSLSEAHRLKIISVLIEGPIEYKKLLEITGLSKTALSHHLSSLLKVKLLIQETRGSYQLTEDCYNLLTSIMDTYIASNWKKIRDAERHAELIQEIYKSERKMKEEYKLFELPIMKVACFRAISESPEYDAFNKLRDWASLKGLLEDIEKNPIYGFERPDLYKSEKIRAYEFWIKVDSDKIADKEVELRQVPSAKYATTVCKTGGEPWRTIPLAWQKLDEWVKSQGYKMGLAQCLEQHHAPGLSDDFTLTLYYPIS